MQTYGAQILNGVGLGMLLFLVAVGLTLVFGIMRFVNFAHGTFYMLGAYAAFSLAPLIGFGGAAAGAALLVGGLAWLAERTLLHRIYNLAPVYHILITFGLALVLDEIVRMAWGNGPQRAASPPLLQGAAHLGFLIYPRYRLAIIVIAGAVALLLWLLLERSKFGALIRGATESAETVALLGVDVPRVFAWTFALGGALAGLAGALALPLRGADPAMGAEALAVGFVVVVVGGMGSFAGALIAALAVGLVQSLATSIWGAGAEMSIYAGMAIMLLLRPQGLAGRSSI